MNQNLFDNPTITSNVLGVYINIDDDNIRSAKKYLFDKFGSQYASQPHFSLLVTPILRDSEDQLKIELKNYFKTVKSFPVTIGYLDLDAKHNFYQLLLVAPELITIHLDLLNLVQKYRKGAVRQKDLERAKTNYFSEQELAMFKKWGYGRSDETFGAHITIGNVVRTDNYDKTTVFQKLEQLLRPVKTSGIIVDQVVVEMQIARVDLNEYLEAIWSETISLK